MANNLDLMAAEIKDTLTDFMLNHSYILPRNPFEEVLLISPDGDRYYGDLDDPGRKLQAALTKDYYRFYALLCSLLRNQPEDVLSKLPKLHKILSRTIEHKLTWCGTTQEALDRALPALQEARDLLKAACEPAAGVPVFVPDAPAVTAHPPLENWAFEGCERHRILLLPAVLSESGGSIPRIGEYRAKGDLAKGVPLAGGKADLFTVEIAPKADELLTWLDPARKDEGFLLAVLEVMGTVPQTPVAIVTGDAALKGKAEHAKIPCVAAPATGAAK